MGLYHPLSWGDPRYTALLADSYRSDEKQSCTEIGSAGTSPNRRSGLSIRNGVLLYKQLIRPMMEYSCPVWRSPVRFRSRELQVLQSKCLHVATSAPWNTGNKQIHDDLGVPFFTDHIISLRDSTQS